MHRLLVLRCPALLQEDEQGRAGRRFAAMVGAIEQLTPAVDVVAPGICALATRGPSRYFGGDQALATLVAETAIAHGDQQAGVGVADGLFAAMLAAVAAVDGSPVVIAPGATPAFLAPWPVTCLGRPELAGSLGLLGVHQLGQLAALPRRHVLARFGADGAICHDVATGSSGELTGIRQPVRHRAAIGTGGTAQRGFWGADDAGARRAREAVARITAVTGPGAVLVGRRHDGRNPGEWGRLVPWDAAGDSAHRSGPAAGAPWPGRIPRPAPTLVHRHPRPADVVDASGRPVGVTGHGEATAPPARLSVDGSPWQPVHAWAGPWPVDERWWAARRRRAHLQVLAATGAHLLVREQRRWWVEATYD